jgi:hypothetical protein
MPRPSPWTSGFASLGARLEPPPEPAEPCGDCLAPCCWFVLIETGALVTADDLDWIERLLEYERLVVWITGAGNYTLGAIAPCRHLDRDDCRCAVYGRAERPRLCRDYAALSCWYRRQLPPSAAAVWRLDRQLWPAFRRGARLGRGGSVVALPDRRADASGGGGGPPMGSHLAAPVELARSQMTPVTLAVDLPDAILETDAERSELLYFLSNFEDCGVARTACDWFLLVQTRRAAEVAPGPLEGTDGGLGGFSSEGVYRPTRAELASLRERLGSALWRALPGDLERALRD